MPTLAVLRASSIEEGGERLIGAGEPRSTLAKAGKVWAARWGRWYLSQEKEGGMESEELLEEVGLPTALSLSAMRKKGERPWQKTGQEEAQAKASEMASASEEERTKDLLALVQGEPRASPAITTSGSGEEVT